MSRKGKSKLTHRKDGNARKDTIETPQTIVDNSKIKLPINDCGNMVNFNLVSQLDKPRNASKVDTEPRPKRFHWVSQCLIDNVLDIPSKRNEDGGEVEVRVVDIANVEHICQDVSEELWTNFEF
ncbi:hypothetical protein FQA39_LY06733 [Lamprigera yunnana]|nr:hypothetical protein FQA39_LY06733 [Lamprigera yunnana]